MENTTTLVTPVNAGIRYGLITGLVTVIYSFVLMATGLEQQAALGFVTFAILIGGIVMAHRYYKQHNGGFMSYGQGLGIATVAGAVIGALSGIFRYVYVNFIDSGYTQKALDIARAKLEADGNMSDEQVETAMQWTAKMMPTGPLSIVWGILATAFFAFLLSLIISAITKHNRPQFE
ncbi:DUF4199 domain-containing protein [Hymenobacter lutimineralis]|uniref:DUF4199 domain-containing protein n=1 Tax=Hymenobacter lutimineralis TaxID=2606448 RepID=A0A5D6URH2_9BACT|nr:MULTISPECIES: DUF4199 domain-containing protein [Hymenobacter]QIX60604.1 DUF4199 domain-containing protein [Hymenobacter sp. BT18]TYZ06043.1 DUF4199 domain-containing protein [Hymenobacter lutimineralis]